MNYVHLYPCCQAICYTKGRNRRCGGPTRLAPPIGVVRKSMVLRVSAAVREDRGGEPGGLAGEPAYASPGRGAEGAGDE